MSLRDANPDDIEIIGTLIKGLAEYEKLAHEVIWTQASLAEDLFAEGTSTRVTLAIHDETDTVAGLSLWFPTFSTFRGQHGIWLEDLFVLPEFRGQGYGLALLQNLRQRTNGRIEWNVLDWNEPSIAFYRSLGAEPVPGWTRFRWLPSA